MFRGQSGRKLIASDDIAKAPCQEEPSEHLARSIAVLGDCWRASGRFGRGLVLTLEQLSDWVFAEWA